MAQSLLLFADTSVGAVHAKNRAIAAARAESQRLRVVVEDYKGQILLYVLSSTYFHQLICMISQQPLEHAFLDDLWQGSKADM